MAERYYVVATAIIHKHGKYLITKRAASEDKFPGMWTVPGGTLENADLHSIEANNHGLRYEIIEQLVKREVKEETGLSVRGLRWITSLSYQKRGNNAICLSFLCDYIEGEVELNEESVDHEWITSLESLQYPMIDGIAEELFMADDILAGKLPLAYSTYKEKVKRKKREP